MASSRLIVVQLNEVNFDVVRRYAERYELPAFSKLLDHFRFIETFGEEKYDELEPWIQWVSAQTGMTFSEHGVFRLGDIVKTEWPQIFETLEDRGLRVGAISPMNARNMLKRPAYFIPDPWTDTPSDGSPFSERLTNMLRQTVNDNATSRISARSKRTFAEAVVRTFSLRRTGRLLGMIAQSRRKPWMKSLVLDQLIHIIHHRLWQRTRPDASFVFFNAGAHIQHHYFFNSEFGGSESRNPAWYAATADDPVRDMLEAYDRILGDYLVQSERGVRLIVATGLTQVPYDRLKFYYRLADHAEFLRRIGISFTRVLPRMTRDFEIYFDDEASAEVAARRLRQVTMARDGVPLVNEADRKGCSVFASLTYASEILADDVALCGDLKVTQFGGMVAFVAIKNGMHSTKGFAFISPDVPTALPAKPVHVASLFDLTLQAASPAST